MAFRVTKEIEYIYLLILIKHSEYSSYICCFKVFLIFKIIVCINPEIFHFNSTFR